MSFALSALYSQFIVRPALPTGDLTGQTYIVTGANVGLGFEAAKHLVRLNATKVILAVRSLSRGEEARDRILSATGRSPDSVDVWHLDLLSTASVQEFAKHVSQLERLDCMLENAGLLRDEFILVEGEESIIKTNVTSTMLLALLVLPKLRESAQRFNIAPRLTIVVSDAHNIATFAEMKYEDIFAALNDPQKSLMWDRYNTSKLIEILFLRELHKHLSPSPVILNFPNPGLCHSNLGRNWPSFKQALFGFVKFILARSTEVGSRTLVNAALAGPESDGQYMNDNAVALPSSFVRGEEGAKLQSRVYGQLMAVLESIQLGVSKNI